MSWDPASEALLLASCKSACLLARLFSWGSSVEEGCPVILLWCHDGFILNSHGLVTSIGSFHSECPVVPVGICCEITGADRLVACYVVAWLSVLSTNQLWRVPPCYRVLMVPSREWSGCCGRKGVRFWTSCYHNKESAKLACWRCWKRQCMWLTKGV
jgi:hypothetical protein